MKESSFVVGRGPSRSVRYSIIAILLVFASVGAVSTARAPSAPVRFMYQLAVLAGPTSIDLCVGEDVWATAILKGRRAKVPPRGRRPVWKSELAIGESIKGVVANPAIGHLSPGPVAQTEPLTALAEFWFVADKPGSTTITWSYDGTFTDPATGQTIPVSTAVSQVTVSSCKWQVEVESNWYSSAPGFLRHFKSAFSVELDIQQVATGGPTVAASGVATLTETANVTNIATGAPIGACVARFTTPPTTADVHVSRARNNDILLSLFYAPVHATTKVVCPGGQGMAMDVGSPLATPLMNLRFSRAGGTVVKSHLLKAQPRDLRGRTLVIVTESP